MKISVSMLSTYLYCPRMLFLQRVLEFEEPPKESLVLGSIRHEVYDYINKEEEKIVSSINEKADHNRIKEMYTKSYAQKVREIIIKNKPRMREVNLRMMDAFKRTWPYIMMEADIRANNIFSFMQEHNIYGKELWENLTPKIISELRIDSVELKLKGIIDRVEMHEDGYVPIELKTGKMPKEGMWPGHRIQIAAYALLLQEKFNKPIKEGFVHYLDSQQKRHLAINPFIKDEVTALVNKVITLLRSQTVPNYCENKNKCTNCGLREQCYNEEEISMLIEENQ